MAKLSEIQEKAKELTKLIEDNKFDRYSLDLGTHTVTIKKNRG